MIKNIQYLLALHSIDGLGPVRVKALLAYFHDPKIAWESDAREIVGLGIPQTIANRLTESRKTFDLDVFIGSLAKSGIKWVTVYDADYPKLLSQIFDPPTVLYYKGDISQQDQRAVAVVGTRKITGYGRVVTAEFTKALVSAGYTIVSGLARGVDSQSHQTAISEQGRTIAVLGGGLNRIFPPENITLAEKIANGFGAVVSEFPPDHPSLPGNFPARNRIISGLSVATLVTEAASDSGSLITARLALEQGREVFAVPGPITSAMSRGPVELIREGARIVFEPKDIFEELGIDASAPPKIAMSDLTTEESMILNCLENETMHIDEICRKLNLSAAKVSANLLKMEIAGLIRNLGSGTYSRN